MPVMGAVMEVASEKVTHLHLLTEMFGVVAESQVSSAQQLE
jgi:hypothetical protein